MSPPSIMNGGSSPPLAKLYKSPRSAISTCDSGSLASNQSSTKGLSPLFTLLESGDWIRATDRVREFPEEAKKWACVKPSRSRTGQPTADEGAMRLPLHHACLKLRNCSQKLAASETIDALLNAFPEAAKERESKHGCLPLHLAAFGVSSHGAPNTSQNRTHGPLARAASQAIFTDRNQNSIALSRNPSLSLSCSSSLSETSYLSEQTGISAMFHDTRNGPTPRFPHKRISSLDGVQVLGPNEDGSIEVMECQSQDKVAVKIIEMLIRAHPKGCRETAEGGRLPLHMACAGKATPEVVQALLSIYRDAARQRNHDGYLPLHLCALYGVSDEEVAIMLLRAYPDAAVGRNKFERIPLEEALFNAGENGRAKQEELVKVLRKHPSYWTRPLTMNSQVHNAADGVSDSNKVFDPNQRMATLSLHPSTSRPPTSPDRSSASRDIAELAESSDVTFLIKTGEWIAVKERCKIRPTEIAEWLTIQSRSGVTVKCSPLHYALERMPPLDVVEAIVAKGKETLSWKMTPGDALPLHVACTWGASAHVVSYLIHMDKGAVKIKDSNGNLPLHQACFSGASFRVVEMLLKSWPESANESNGMGSLPIEIVQRLSHPNKRDVLVVLGKYVASGADMSFGGGCEV